MPDARRRRSSMPAKVVSVCVLGFVWSLIWVNLPKNLLSAWTGAAFETISEPRRPLVLAPVGPSTTIPRAAGTDARQDAERGQPFNGAPAVPTQDATGLPTLPREQPTPSLEREPELNCAEEVKKLCGEIEPGSGRYRDCLRSYGNLLPAACRRRPDDRVAQPSDGARAVLVSCRADVRRLCPQMPMRGGPILQCLRTHAEELSPACTEVLVEQRVLN